MTRLGWLGCKTSTQTNSGLLLFFFIIYLFIYFIFFYFFFILFLSIYFFYDGLLTLESGIIFYLLNLSANLLVTHKTLLNVVSTLSTLDKHFRRLYFKTFSFFIQTTGFVSHEDHLQVISKPVFYEKVKKKYHEFVVFWISPEGSHSVSLTS